MRGRFVGRVRVGVLTLAAAMVVPLFAPAPAGADSVPASSTLEPVGLAEVPPDPAIPALPPLVGGQTPTFRLLVANNSDEEAAPALVQFRLDDEPFDLQEVAAPEPTLTTSLDTILPALEVGHHGLEAHLDPDGVDRVEKVELDVLPAVDGVDLSVTQLMSFPSPPSLGAPAELHALVRNNGSDPARRVSVKFTTSSGAEVGTAELPGGREGEDPAVAVPALGSQLVGVAWNPDHAGDTAVRATIVGYDDDATPEDNTTTNSFKVHNPARVTPPDLAVRSADVSPLEPGDTVHFNAEVENRTSGDASQVVVQFLVDGTPLADVPPVDVPPGVSMQVSSADYVGDGNQHVLRVVADPANHVRESDEANNVIEVPFRLGVTRPGPFGLLPDLAVTAVTATAGTGRSLSLAAHTCNVGDIPISGGHVTFTAHGALKATEVAGAGAFSRLMPAECTDVQRTWTPSTLAGTILLTAHGVPFEIERRVDNNTGTSGPVAVPTGGSKGGPAKGPLRRIVRTIRRVVPPLTKLPGPTPGPKPGPSPRPPWLGQLGPFALPSPSAVSGARSTRHAPRAQTTARAESVTLPVVADGGPGIPLGLDQFVVHTIVRPDGQAPIERYTTATVAPTTANPGMGTPVAATAYVNADGDAGHGVDLVVEGQPTTESLNVIDPSAPTSPHVPSLRVTISHLGTTPLPHLLVELLRANPPTTPTPCPDAPALQPTSMVVGGVDFGTQDFGTMPTALKIQVDVITADANTTYFRPRQLGVGESGPIPLTIIGGRYDGATRDQAVFQNTIVDGTPAGTILQNVPGLGSHQLQENMGTRCLLSRDLSTGGDGKGADVNATLDNFPQTSATDTSATGGPIVKIGSADALTRVDWSAPAATRVGVVSHTAGVDTTGNRSVVAFDGNVQELGQLAALTLYLPAAEGGRRTTTIGWQNDRVTNLVVNRLILRRNTEAGLELSGHVNGLPMVVRALSIVTDDQDRLSIDYDACTSDPAPTGDARFGCPDTPRLTELQLAGQSPARADLAATPPAAVTSIDITAHDVPSEVGIDFRPRAWTPTPPASGVGPAPYRAFAGRPVKTLDYVANAAMRDLVATMYAEQTDPNAFTRTRIDATGVTPQLRATWDDSEATPLVIVDTGSRGFAYDPVGHTESATQSAPALGVVDVQMTNGTLPVDLDAAYGGARRERQWAQISQTPSGHALHAHVEGLRWFTFSDGPGALPAGDAAPRPARAQSLQLWAEPPAAGTANNLFAGVTIDADTKVRFTTTVDAVPPLMGYSNWTAAPPGQRSGPAGPPPPALVHETQWHSVYGANSTNQNDTSGVTFQHPVADICLRDTTANCAGGIQTHLEGRTPITQAVSAWMDAYRYNRCGYRDPREGSTAELRTPAAFDVDLTMLNNLPDADGCHHADTAGMHRIAVNAHIPPRLTLSFGPTGIRAATDGSPVAGELKLFGDDESIWEGSPVDTERDTVQDDLHIKLTEPPAFASEINLEPPDLVGLWARVADLTSFEFCATPNQALDPSPPPACVRNGVSYANFVTATSTTTTNALHALVEQPAGHGVLDARVTALPNDVGLTWNAKPLAVNLAATGEFVGPADDPNNGAALDLHLRKYGMDRIPDGDRQVLLGDELIRLPKARLPQSLSLSVRSWQTPAHAEQYAWLPQHDPTTNPTTTYERQTVCDNNDWPWKHSIVRISTEHGSTVVPDGRVTHVAQQFTRPTNPADLWENLELEGVQLDPADDGTAIAQFLTCSENKPGEPNPATHALVWVMKGGAAAHVKQYVDFWNRAFVRPGRTLEAFDPDRSLPWFIFDPRADNGWEQRADVQVCNGFRGWFHLYSSLLWYTDDNFRRFEGGWHASAFFATPPVFFAYFPPGPVVPTIPFLTPCPWSLFPSSPRLMK
ncbi:MAG: hypothetical protein QOE35_550 [Actinomycetota bacterium]|jgi:hypothetical protein